MPRSHPETQPPRPPAPASKAAHSALLHHHRPKPEKQQQQLSDGGSRTPQWDLIDQYFSGDNSRYRLTQHHLQSYSDFIRYKIPTILQDFNSGNHSTVYSGVAAQHTADAPGDRTSSTSTPDVAFDSSEHVPSAEDAGSLNIGARLQFFVGMDPLDVHTHFCMPSAPLVGSTPARHGEKRKSTVASVHQQQSVSRSETVPAPTKIQVRNQVIEHSHLPGKPRRFVTPNEARLRNLNYQIEMTATVTAVHRDDMTRTEAETHGDTVDVFVQHCLSKWHARYSSVRNLLLRHVHSSGNRRRDREDSKSYQDSGQDSGQDIGSGGGASPDSSRGGEAARVVHTVDVLRYELLGVALGEAATGGSKSSGNKTAAESLDIDATILRDTLFSEWATRAGAISADYTTAVDYVSQRIAAACDPFVTMYDDVELTKIPLMLHSPFCVLRDQPNAALRDMGECPYEKGGYFVVRGKEKVIISQEKYIRNIIQTRIKKVVAPPTYSPPSTLILHRNQDKPTPPDMEEIFEAQINCSDDPKPPVMVSMQFKRLYQYARGGGSEPHDMILGREEGDNVVHSDHAGMGDMDALQKQHQEMRRHMNFRGLYITLFTRKGESGEPILKDFPLVTLFRAMGVTNPTSARSGERLSDREIIECILGFDSSGTVKVTVSEDGARSLCGVHSLSELQSQRTCWYTPGGDGDCAWVSVAPSDHKHHKPPHHHQWTVGTQVVLHLRCPRPSDTATKKHADRPSVGEKGGVKTDGAVVVVCDVVAVHPNQQHFKVRWRSAVSTPVAKAHSNAAPDVSAEAWGIWSDITRFHAHPKALVRVERVTLGTRTPGESVEVSGYLTPCRYERRHKASVLQVDKDTRDKKRVVLTYTTHTPQNRTYDPILLDLLQPSIAEGSFAPSVQIAQDILDKSINTNALREQVGPSLHTDATSGTSTSASKSYATMRREALFRTLFTHLNGGGSTTHGAADGPTTATVREENTHKIRDPHMRMLRQKQFYLGYMAKRLLFAYLGLDDRETSKDSYQLRRVQSSGEMLAEVFRYEYFQLGNKYKEYVATGMRQQGEHARFKTILAQTVVRTNLFDARYMTDRLQKSFMGNWGSKVAVDADQKAYCQELIRLSYYGSISYLRRVHKELPSTTAPGQKKGTSKAVTPRLLHASEYGVICPVETPDGGNIGKIKHLSTFAFVCPELPPEDRRRLMSFVRQFSLPVHELDSFYKLSGYHKVIVDGNWCFVCPAPGTAAATAAAATAATGNVRDGGRRGRSGERASDVAHTSLQQPMLRITSPRRTGATAPTRTSTFTLEHPPTPLPPDLFVHVLRLLRRNGLLSPLVSIYWNIARQEIVITTQEGRVLRPLLTVEHGLLRFSDGWHNAPANDQQQQQQQREVGPDGGRWSWAELLSGRDHACQRTPETRAHFHDLCHRYDQPDGSGWRAKVPHFDTQPMHETLKQLQCVSGVMEYLDPLESGSRMVAMNPTQLPDRHTFFREVLRLRQQQQQQRKGVVSGEGCGLAFTHPTYKNEKTAILIEDHPRHHSLRHKLIDATKTSSCPSTTSSRVSSSSSSEIQYRSTYTHCELHPTLMLGVMAMLVPFPEHSQAPRNLYSCHQSKQALGVYVSNYRKRMDHANHILHHPERPLAASRYAMHLNQERLNYGTNVIVAIMCYGGYNIEDALLLNKRSVERGLFQSTYYFTEEVTEKDTPNEKVLIGRNAELPRSKGSTCSYSKVDAHPLKVGVVPDTFLDSEVDEGDVLIEACEDKSEPGADTRAFTDYKRTASKSGAFIDQIYLSDNARGRRVAKVTLRKIRTPTIGDKFASRCGQKGTAGALVEEEDMPFITSDDGDGYLAGVRPDIILNPHAIPSRMTIGQLLESLSCVIGCKVGVLADSTPLCSNTSTRGATSDPSATLGILMERLGMNKHGNQRMVCGVTGDTLHSRVFVGPTYYQRLKQMPEDKYYHRRQGREDMVTRQPIGGRAQGGALKLGEMERDSVMAHGVATFMKEAWNEKSDGFQYRVSTDSGYVEPPMVENKVDFDTYTPLQKSMDSLNEGDIGGFREYLRHDASDVEATLSHAEVVDADRRPTNVHTTKVNVPFAMRLLTQECEAMGVGVHLQTNRSFPTRIRRTVPEPK
jgi:DNA-directed RNA polymerase beta subunit